MQGPYHYETVSGFVCEAFGYIPRTGESIKMLLKNAEDEKSDADLDNQENRKDKVQKFRLEVCQSHSIFQSLMSKDMLSIGCRIFA